MSKKKSNNNASINYYTLSEHKSGMILGINFSKNPEQRELIRLMNDNFTPIIACTGKAGTGKTFTAVAAAIDLVKIQRKYSKIYYIREPLEVGRSLGFLPGTLEDKFGVYCDGLIDNLNHISRFLGINENDMKSLIETIPPQYTRGRSFENAIILVDEAENLSLDTIQTLSTRLGKYCKLVFMGSMNQIDIKGKSQYDNDFVTAINILESIEPKIFEKVEFKKSERSEYCKIIDDAFCAYKEKNK